jgi:hypothetical protein
MGENFSGGVAALKTTALHLNLLVGLSLEKRSKRWIDNRNYLES